METLHAIWKYSGSGLTCSYTLVYNVLVVPIGALC